MKTVIERQCNPMVVVGTGRVCTVLLWDHLLRDRSLFFFCHRQGRLTGGSYNPLQGRGKERCGEQPVSAVPPDSSIQNGAPEGPSPPQEIHFSGGEALAAHLTHFHKVSVSLLPPMLKSRVPYKMLNKEEKLDYVREYITLFSSPESTGESLFKLLLRPIAASVSRGWG